MTSPGTLEVLALALGEALRPLESELEPERVRDLFLGLGIGLPPDLPSNLTNTLSAVSEAAQTLGEALDALALVLQQDDPAQIIESGLDLLGRVAELVTAIEALEDVLEDQFDTLTGFARKLIDQLIVRSLERRHRTAAAILVLAGGIERSYDPGVPGNSAKPPYVVRTLRLERLGKLLASPLDLAKEVFGWNLSTFDANGLAARFQQFLVVQGVPAALTLSPPAMDPRVDSFLFGLEAKVSPASVTLTVLPPVDADFDTSFELAPGWTLHSTVIGQFPAETRIEITPPHSVDVLATLGESNLALKSELSIVPVLPQKALLLLGQAGGSRLETAAVSIGVAFVIKEQGGSRVGEPFLQFAIEGGKLVLEPSKSGLIATLFGDRRFEGSFDLRGEWSPAAGLHFEGGGKTELRIPVDFSFGPIELESLYLGLGFTQSGIPIELSAALRLNLGPVEISVDRMGVKAELSFPASGGNLGLANFNIGFKPPNALGLRIEAGPISGGGFLDLQLGPPERYAGALALNLLSVSIAAYGLCERTKAGALSFVVVLGIRFSPAIQLGFGLALRGVGGLVGINRRADSDALRERLTSGAAGSLLFPENPLQNASTLLSNLGAIFPVADGVFVFGPTLQIEWMQLPEGAFARLDIGVFLELPGPSKLVILGSLRAAVPKAETLLRIRLDVVGIFDFQRKLIWIDAALINSEALEVFTLSGDAALRACYGDHPYFGLSIGGFHPHFKPEPAVFPELRRVALALKGAQGIQRYSLRAEAYFAVTTNSLQFGGAIEIGVPYGPFRVIGFVRLDVLFQFTPFYFEIAIAGGFRILFLSEPLVGLQVSGLLCGPGPVVLRGTFTIEILFFDVTFEASIRLGGNQQQPLPSPIGSVVQALAGELSAPGNLSAISAGDKQVSVEPRASSHVLISPLDGLTWTQRRTPLNLLLERFEGQPLASPQSLSVEANFARKGAVQDWFSPGSFTTLTESESLQRPSFERLDAGIALGFASESSSTLDREIHVIEIRKPNPPDFGLLLAFALYLYSASCARTGPAVARTMAPKFSVTAPQFVVRGNDGNLTHGPRSRSDAYQRARQTGGHALAENDLVDLGEL